MYEYDFSRKLLNDKEFREYVLNLKGKKLGCFCKKTRSEQEGFILDDTPCHGEIIANFVNTYYNIV